MSEQTQDLAPKKSSAKKSKFPWGFFFTLFVVVSFAAFLYLNKHLLDIFDSKGETIVVETKSYDKDFREQRALLRELLGTLEAVKSELNEVKQSQTDLFDRLDTLENKTSVTVKMEDTQEKAIKGLIDSQEKRLQKFEDSLDRNTSLKAAFKELRLIIATAKPFAEAFGAVHKLLSEDHQEILDAISPYKKIGIPQTDYLSGEFELVSKDLLKADEPDGSWWEKIVIRVKRLIRVSKKGDRRPGIYGDVGDVQALIKLKNFELALEKSKEISSDSKVKETWEQHVQAYVESQKTLATLTSLFGQQKTGDE